MCEVALRFRVLLVAAIAKSPMAKGYQELGQRCFSCSCCRSGTSCRPLPLRLLWRLRHLGKHLCPFLRVFASSINRVRLSCDDVMAWLANWSVLYLRATGGTPAPLACIGRVVLVCCVLLLVACASLTICLCCLLVCVLCGVSLCCVG